MSQKLQKKKQEECYDKEKKPVIRSSTYHDEQVAGFMDLQTGEFTEVMLIHNSKDMDKFLETYDISVAEIIKE